MADKTKWGLKNFPWNIYSVGCKLNSEPNGIVIRERQRKPLFCIRLEEIGDFFFTSNKNTKVFTFHVIDWQWVGHMSYPLMLNTTEVIWWGSEITLSRLCSLLVTGVHTERETVGRRGWIITEGESSGFFGGEESVTRCSCWARRDRSWKSLLRDDMVVFIK